MKKTVLVTGGDSLLASYLFAPRYSGLEFLKCKHDALDITSFKSIVDRIELCEMKPGDVILNCAAFTDVGSAEQEDSKDKLKAINVIGPKNLAEACRHYKLKLIQISTDYVYDGDQLDIEFGYSHRTDYSHEKPLNEYGKSKLQGEKAIASIFDDYLIIRTAGLYGENCKKQTFLHRILKKALTREVNQIDVFDDCRCSFTYAKDLANWITHWIMVEEGIKYNIIIPVVGKIINVVNRPNNPFIDSVHRFVEKFLDEMNMQQFSNKLNKISFPKDGICSDGICRPKNAILYNEIDSNKKLSEYIGFKMPSTEHALRDFCLNNYRALIEKAELGIAIDNSRIFNMSDKLSIEEIDF